MNISSLTDNARSPLDLAEGSDPAIRVEPETNYRSIALATVGIATLVRLISVAHLPLGNGEAYYFTWSRFLDWSYLDHPPLIAWLVRVTTLLGTWPAAVRLGPILACGAFGLLFHRLAERLVGARAALFALVLVTALPVFLASSFIVNPEAPLAPLWVGYMLVVESMRRRNEPVFPLLAGALLGLAFLAKYTAILLVPATILYALAERPMRRWLARPSFYAGGAVAMLFASPVLYWNQIHNWPTIRLHLVDRVHVGVPAAGENTVNTLVEISSSHGATLAARLGRLLVGQVMSYSPLLAPLLAIGIVWALVAAFKRDGRGTFLSAFTWPVLLPLLAAMSMLNNSEQHWTMMAFVPAAMGAGYLLDLSFGAAPRHLGRMAIVQRFADRGVKGLFAAGVALSAIAFVAAHVYARTPSLLQFMPATYDPRADMVNELVGWDQVRAGIAEATTPGNVVLASNQASLCGRLLFETGDSPAVYCPAPTRTGFEFWDRQTPPSNATVIALTSDILPDMPVGLEDRTCGAPQEIDIDRGGRRVARYFLHTCEPPLSHQELRASRDK